MATLIHNVNELQNISLDLAGDYEIVNDIDATGFAFVPISTIAAPFTGHLHGNRHTITNLTITVAIAATCLAALFVRNNGTIEDVNLENCQITGNSGTSNSYVGSIAVRNYGLIQNCHVTGALTSLGNSGIGIYTTAGGFVDSNYAAGIIRRSHSEASVTVVSTSHSTGSGFVDLNLGTIEQSYGTGNVSITSTNPIRTCYAGGFLSENGLTVNDCYSRSNVTAIGGVAPSAGAFIYNNHGTIRRSYSTGIPVGAAAVAGFCVLNTSIVDSCFWDTETSGVGFDPVATGRTTAEMKTAATFAAVGWDIEEVPVAGNDGYPYLAWHSVWHIYVAAVPPPPLPPPLNVLTLPATEVR